MSTDPLPIIEGLVTTIGDDGEYHLAPMGPRIGDGGTRLLLRPFPSSTTFQNLKNRRAGVFHITDDVDLIARSAVGRCPRVPVRPAEHVEGWVVTSACRYLEFRVRSIDESQERMHVEAEVVHTGRIRDFFGFNRAKHAVIEAAILATRIHLIPAEEITRDLQRFKVWVEKTGGPAEFAAFAFLEEHIAHSARGSR